MSFDSEGTLWIRDLTEILCGIRENANFLDGVRDLIATREAGFAKIFARDAALGEKNGIRDRDDSFRDKGLSWKSELPDPGQLQKE